MMQRYVVGIWILLCGCGSNSGNETAPDDSDSDRMVETDSIKEAMSDSLTDGAVTSSHTDDTDEPIFESDMPRDTQSEATKADTPSDTQDSDVESVDTQKNDTQPDDTQGGDTEPVDTQIDDTGPADTQIVDTQPSDTETQTDPTEVMGTLIAGVATYYDADGGGACMFDPDLTDIHVAALNKVQWNHAGWCGACADIDGPDGSVHVRIVDQCPGCKHGHLDLHPEAFDMIAERRLGIVDITWRFVPCEVEGPLMYKYKDASNPWWTGVQVRNHPLPISSLEWSTDGVSWNDTVRQDYNYFEDPAGFGEGSVSIRVTAIDGQVVEDTLPPVESELEVIGTTQFN